LEPVISESEREAGVLSPEKGFKIRRHLISVQPSPISVYARTAAQKHTVPQTKIDVNAAGSSPSCTLWKASTGLVLNGSSNEVMLNFSAAMIVWKSLGVLG
jgi:hypothetical protein